MTYVRCHDILRPIIIYLYTYVNVSKCNNNIINSIMLFLIIKNNLYHINIYGQQLKQVIYTLKKMLRISKNTLQLHN